MTICHHPPDRLLDGDDVEDKLSARALFQVFGHKHKQRVIRETSYVRWGAGAVNLSRSERQFEPGYNIIELNVAGEGADRRIDVQSHMFKFQSNPEGFHPIKDDLGSEVFRHSMSFPAELARVSSVVAASAEDEVIVDAAIVQEAMATATIDAEASMGDKWVRHLVDRFWDLDASDRREIALDLALITKEEIQLPEAQRYGVALIRAVERSLIDRLDEMIAERE